MPRIKVPSQLERDLLEAFDDVLADVRGTVELPRHHVEIGAVTAARQRLEMSQQEFAEFLNVPVSTVKKWEQGVRNPSGAARVLLTVIEREPDAVRRAVRGERKGTGRGRSPLPAA